MRKQNKTYPVNLIMRGQRCLVVGGGKVATRKIKGLLDLDCQIDIVSPKITKFIKDLADKTSVNVYERDFIESDIDNIDLAYIATGDRRLNKEILRLCSMNEVLCCAVDSNWKDGDFITPASIEKHGISIAVSTHGESCRKTRLIKNNLARHIEMVENAELLILGTDHNSLNLAERGPIHLVGEKLQRTGELLSHIWGIHEYMLINTCNRIELAAIVSPDQKMEILMKQVMGFAGLEPDSYYIKYGFEAFTHLSTVLSGLMSQTPGEKYITAQLKDSLETAKLNGWADSMMQEWMDSALHVSKHVRQKVEPFLKNFEIEDISMKYIKTECHDLKKKKALVLGTGVIGATIAEKLLPYLEEICWCYHQNRPEPLPDTGVLRIVNMKELKEQLPKIDLLICATSSSHPLIHEDHALFFDSDRSILVLDLSSPRNVSPELENLLGNIKIIDLDDLKHWFRREAVDMTRVFEVCDGIISEHRDLYKKIIFGFQGKNKE